MNQQEKILVTGAAGFIGAHVAKAFCEKGHKVVGIDSVNEYYDVQLKRDRITNVSAHPNYQFEEVDIVDKPSLDALFQREQFTIVVNLAAQAGVRYSIEQPYKYIDSNLIGFINILEACRNFPVKHLFFASSSSVYGNNRKIPFSTDDVTDAPVSLYAATKKSNELMAYSYSHLYDIPVTGLRFFTVYGPWGRPDMAYFSFTKNIIDGKTINLFNNGQMRRDFTYIDDVVEGITRLFDALSVNEFKWNLPDADFRMFNIGNHQPVELLTFVNTLEEILHVKANINFLPMQDGDVLETYADVEPLRELTGFTANTHIKDGLTAFVKWYKSYYK